MPITATTLIVVSMIAGNTISPLTMMLSFSNQNMCVTALKETMEMQLKVAQSNLTGAQQPTLEKKDGGYRLATPMRLMSEGKCVTSQIIN